jgi:transposase-like protein
MSQVRILFCACPHPDQDRRYGKQRRAHNRTAGVKRPDWRCTACGFERNATDAAEVRR